MILCGMVLILDYERIFEWWITLELPWYNELKRTRIVFLIRLHYWKVICKEMMMLVSNLSFSISFYLSILQHFCFPSTLELKGFQTLVVLPTRTIKLAQKNILGSNSYSSSDTESDCYLPINFRYSLSY